ncbi:hypothetical protein [Buttiauxella agrestis]|uniref:Uncharacterized protein n=1 Tax=Buttiauxella agrestis ATCC 33320 TaxID=1006004 RepID=A0A085GCZ8_9ENTR|nr:hypothetical protein [Buttiauxella agrestis]KFC81593.1 hypothetical protein GBAG_2378 [Buttiauxella agrestis ATCC 33320]
MAIELETLNLPQPSGGVPNNVLPLVLYHHVPHELRHNKNISVWQLIITE